MNNTLIFFFKKPISLTSINTTNHDVLMHFKDCPCYLANVFLLYVSQNEHDVKFYKKKIINIKFVCNVIKLYI